MPDFAFASDVQRIADGLIWTEEASPRVLRLETFPQRSALFRFLPVHHLAAGIPQTQDGDGQRVQWPIETLAHDLFSPGGGDQQTFNAVLLPLDDAFETRLQAAGAFWRTLNGREGATPCAELPVQSRLRHVLNLRVLDGRQGGASQRDLAEVLLTREPIPARDWRDHHLRHKLKAVSRRANKLVGGGYRDLLFYPHRRRASSPGV